VWRRLIQAAVAAALCPASAWAGTLAVDPVQVAIDENRRTASVKIVNRGAAPSIIKVKALAWSQVDGRDVREPTADLIASPPVVTIAPGATQIVRVGFRNPGRRRGSYRLILEETPELNGSGVRVALRLDLPVFAYLKAAAVDAVNWSAWKGADGHWVIEASNAHDGHVRLALTDIAAGSGLKLDGSLAPGVVLPRSSRRWILAKPPEVADPLRWAHVSKEQGIVSRNLASKEH
jgi:fimbrial chaperone protein